MVAAGIDPFVVEAVELIIVVYAFVFTEVEGGKRNGKTVLVVGEANLPTAVEHGLDGSALGGTHQLVVDFQVAESQRYAPQRVDVGGVEHGDAVGAAEYQTAV